MFTFSPKLATVSPAAKYAVAVLVVGLLALLAGLFYLGWQSAQVPRLSISVPSGDLPVVVGATTTVNYSVSRLPHLGKDGHYALGIQLIDANGQGSRSYAGTSTSNQSDILGQHSLAWNMQYIPGYSHMPREGTYKLRLNIVQVSPAPLPSAMQANAKAKHMTQEQIDALKLTLGTKVIASTTSATFTVLYPDDQMEGPDRGQQYIGAATVLIAAHRMFDVWGGRFELKLDQLTPQQAVFSKYLDGKSVGSVTVPYGKQAPLEISGTTPAMTNTYPQTISRKGTITYTKQSASNAAYFTIDTKEMPSVLIFTSAKQAYAFPATVTSGQATLHVSYVSPFTIRVDGTVGNDTSCSPKSDYTLTYDNDTQLLISPQFAPQTTCKAVTYSNVHTFSVKAARVYKVTISLFADHNGFPTHFDQESVLVHVRDDGTMQIDPPITY